LAQEQENTEPFNTRLPTQLRANVKKAAIDLGMKLQRFSALSYKIFLYINQNEGLSSTKELANAAYPMVCLRTARNDLAKQGHDIAGLDLEIKKAEEFLQK
jgi:hypothetical protein